MGFRGSDKGRIAPIRSREIQTMTSHLIELGQQALATVSSSVAGSAPLVKYPLRTNSCLTTSAFGENRRCRREPF
jgi:hypothetical protein